MNPDRDLVLAYALLPGFGFFSPKGPLRLRIVIGQKIRKLSIFFDRGKPDAYTFPVLQLFGPNGKELDKEALIESVSLSGSESIEEAENLLQMVRNGKRFRSLQESRPGMIITLKKPVEISHIRLGNRHGRMGQKARYVCVDGYARGNLVLNYRNNSPEALLKEARAIHVELGVNWPQKDDADIQRHCRELRSHLVSSLEQNQLSWSSRRLGQFLDLFQPKLEMSPFNLRLAAEVVTATFTDRSAVATSTFSPLSPLLNTPKRLEQVVSLANQIMSDRKMRDVRVIAGKHAFQESVLQKNRNRYLAALDQIFPALQACGTQSMLAYGSLLGAVRDGGFMAHDDDVDVLYFDGSSSRAEALERRATLVSQLVSHGFKMNGRFKNANFHLSNGNAKIDLFPCWKEGEVMHVMRSYPKYEPFPASDLFPSGLVQLHNRAYPAPANAEAFLEWRYGAGWSVPDPYHEWPWQLQQTQ